MISEDDIEYVYDEEKSKKLRRERGFGFEEIITLVESGGLVATIKNHDPINRPNQHMFVVGVEDYIWLVPHYRDGNVVKLMTCYPSRKAKKEWKGKLPV